MIAILILMTDQKPPTAPVNP
ncbi:hypothetical protein OYC64_000341 [Pagothenia borchgrevinki]|uniref:Uncharacterized protein n=1 Tax=Pagothenia borchgrevinki TaxID=8213 RepID=A0ABD2HDK6_PAGBO